MKRLMAVLAMMLVVFGGGVLNMSTARAEDGSSEVSADFLPDLKIAKIDIIGGEVEIFNNSLESVDLQGVDVLYYSASKVDLGSYTRVIGSVEEEMILQTGGKMSFEGTLAKSGGSVGLFYGDELLDLVGWGSAKNLFEEAKVPTKVSSTGSFERCADGNGVIIDSDNNVRDFHAVCEEEIFEEEMTDARNIDSALVVKDCSALRINEISANTDYEKQFVEVRNTSGEEFNLAGCLISTAKSKKIFVFGEISLKSNELLAVNLYAQGIKLIKSTSDTVYILSSDGTEVGEMSYANLKTGTSWARLGETWAMTYVPTPDEENVYERYPACAVGYERNTETGKCNKIAAGEVKKEKICADNQFLNPLTNRCKKVETVAEKKCADGQYLNPETNRCRRIVVAAGMAPCAEGYERSTETNRCRKIKENLGAGYAVRYDAASDGGSPVALVCLGLVGVIGAGYLGYSFRMEIMRVFMMIYDKIRVRRRKSADFGT